VALPEGLQFGGWLGLVIGLARALLYRTAAAT
jgi:hypothetical protein